MLKAKDPLRAETEGNSEANSSCWRVKSVPSRFNETRNKLNTLTASISLLFVRSKMAVCILNRKRDSLYPLTLQPAYHFRTQNWLIKVCSIIPTGCWTGHKKLNSPKNICKSSINYKQWHQCDASASLLWSLSVLYYENIELSHHWGCFFQSCVHTIQIPDTHLFNSVPQDYNTGIRVMLTQLTMVTIQVIRNNDLAWMNRRIFIVIILRYNDISILSNDWAWRFILDLEIIILQK